MTTVTNKVLTPEAKRTLCLTQALGNVFTSWPSFDASAAHAKLEQIAHNHPKSEAIIAEFEICEEFEIWDAEEWLNLVNEKTDDYLALLELYDKSIAIE